MLRGSRRRRCTSSIAWTSAWNQHTASETGAKIATLHAPMPMSMPPIVEFAPMVMLEPMVMFDPIVMFMSIFASRSKRRELCRKVV
jgi:hypothetical protein